MFAHTGVSFVTGMLAMSVLASAAQAHHRLGREKESCAVKIGPDIIQFTAYQAQDPEAEFCKDIPDVGAVTMVLDYVDAELRGMTADIRVIKVFGGAMSGAPDVLNDAELAPEVLDAVTETHLKPKLYPSGTINFAHTFTNAGRYYGIVTIKNDHGQIYVSGFPFSVGQTYKRTLVLYGLFAASIVAGVGLYWVYGSKLRAATVIKKA
jgi:hypothetical protein